MGGIVVGECNQDHEKDGQHRKDKDAQRGQGEQRLVEVVIHQGAEVVLAALQRLAGPQDLFRDLVLADIGSPGVEKGNDKEDRQNAVEQDAEGVIAGLIHPGVQELIVQSVGDGMLLAEGRQHLQPVCAAAGDHHVDDKDDLKQKEHQSAEHLPAGNAAKAHHGIGQLGLPIALNEGGNDVLPFVYNAETKLPEEAADPFDAVPDAQGDRRKEAQKTDPEFLPL